VTFFLIFPNICRIPLHGVEVLDSVALHGRGVLSLLVLVLHVVDQEGTDPIEGTSL